MNPSLLHATNGSVQLSTSGQWAVNKAHTGLLAVIVLAVSQANSWLIQKTGKGVCWAWR